MTDMACATQERPELIEAYLLGELDEPARELFERHLFACDRCFSHLQMLETLQSELRAQERTIRAASTPAPRQVPWRWMAAAASVLIVTGLAVWRPWSAGPQPPVASGPGAGSPAAPRSALTPEAVFALTTIDPPRYVALELRGSDTDAVFAEAMRAYAAGDYTTAASGLRRARALGSNPIPADFFLAVALLMTGFPNDAMEPLKRVVDYGESPYRQLASLYLGKALVRSGDLDGADAEWTRTAALPGTHAREAEDLIKALRSARAGAR